jgi:serine protease Do
MRTSWTEPDEVLVTLTDKREFKAKIIGADKRTDVAVVKIDATGLPAVRVGRRVPPEGRRVGDGESARPFGLDNTVHGRHRERQGA